MLNYDEPASSSTIVPLTSVSCSQSQEHTIASPGSSYAIGPVDPAQITTLHVQLPTDEAFSLLVPVHLPASILAHPVFKEGYEWGYLEGDPEEEEWTVPKLVNEIYGELARLDDEHEPDAAPWTLGFLLGELASVAQRDKILALTGLAHVCFLLPLLTQDRPPCWPCYELYHARYLHHRAVRTYRGRVRVYREQGKSFAEAQRLALATQAQ